MSVLRRLRSLGLRRPRIVKRFGRMADGSTTVEFALIAMPFFVLLFGLVEIALTFFASQLLETATADAARQILTGRAQAASFDRAAFANAVCGNFKVLLDCSGVVVDVQKVASFDAANTSGPARNSDGTVNYSGTGYAPGAGGDIVMVKVYYEWPVMVPTFGLAAGDLPNGKRLLQATAVFRNEPFPTSSSPSP
ncbi:TadE/TadG family type IV pilus assembly protein [Phreatobacter sp. AB_2022a]|uniref:TadE/TadG family type IV pilus assembly protein n=1 Tax=Phreatobacter sp. AB_2022a TaxID=3003134 RepID=UPI00228748CE|nr:TadE/TadG family type IV pilus assembly protein [Phreatobacter sp. AB_2022a]MCZ0736033.1 pilus assembly protein [Phreatobacter sp. AB_2022a]